VSCGQPSETTLHSKAAQHEQKVPSAAGTALFRIATAAGLWSPCPEDDPASKDLRKSSFPYISTCFLPANGRTLQSLGCTSLPATYGLPHLAVFLLSSPVRPVDPPEKPFRIT